MEGILLATNAADVETKRGRGRYPANDLTGRTFTRLRVVGRNKDNASNGMALYGCLCDCGRVTLVRSDNLLTGQIKSCGCLNRENIDRARQEAARRALVATMPFQPDQNPRIREHMLATDPGLKAEYEARIAIWLSPGVPRAWLAYLESVRHLARGVQAWQPGPEDFRNWLTTVGTAIRPTAGGTGP